MEKNFKFVTINFAKLNNFCGEIYKEIENNNFIDLINKDITKIKDEEIKVRLLLIGNSICRSGKSRTIILIIKMDFKVQWPCGISC